jgi:ribosomal protein L29
MTLPKYKELNLLETVDEIDQEIFLFQKNLFDLRMKRSSNQKISSHLFTHYKRRIAQLHFKKQFILSKTKK